MSSKYLSWLAGFVDGEGCFFHRYRKGKGYDFWLIVTQYYPIGKKVLEEIKSETAMGSVTRKSNPNGYHWRVGNKKHLLKLLPKLIPLLRVKKKEANIFYKDLRAWTKT